LDELTNDITGSSAAFEPAIDYVVVKWPRFSFEKFPGVDTTLGTQMKSVGEVMAMGRTFCEALEKAARSLETGHHGVTSLRDRVDYRALARNPNEARDMVMEGPRAPTEDNRQAPPSDDELRAILRVLVARPQCDRLLLVADAMRVGLSVDALFDITAMDPWFLHQVARLVRLENELRAQPGPLSKELLLRAKQLGFSDSRIALLTPFNEREIRAQRLAYHLRPRYNNVDTCAAEMPARTPYLYATYDGPPGAEIAVSGRKKVIILGGGPNRIGQGIEFDYCCCHASFAMRELGIEAIMINCNPETVSTDYDTSDRLYFEPLRVEEVLGICREEQRRGQLLGVIVQFGGQTPLRLANALTENNIPLLGTSADAIDRAEDRKRFDALLSKLGLKRPPGRIATTPADALRIAEELTYPVLVRPSYVLGGRAMMICDYPHELSAYMQLAMSAAEAAGSNSILIDKYLNNAVEVDVDAVGDGERVVVAGVMQHIEEAGIHSGDSACVL
ncbi:MAG TPA: carbamoyl-phosphate synthase large subunit, partial [Sorangium sp.]|nr:carbamoyl-phosphate synthase large subunit [Sorangium sp.]